MEIRDTEVLLNLKTGAVRRNIIGPDQRFRYHEGFTEADQEAGWKQISTFSSGYPEEEIAADIERAKAIYLKRKKGIPNLSAIWALCGGVVALYGAQQQIDAPIFTGAMLFFAGFCGFGAGLFSAFELKAPKAATATD